jgi:recombination protein RecT
MADETKAVTTQRKTLKDMLTAENFKEAVKAALPKHLDPERFIRVSITALTKTPKLQNCSPESFFKCLLDLSAMGLEPDGRHAHLIPYGDQCTLILDYKGIVSLVRRSGEISYIHCDVVYDGDTFEYQYGSGSHLLHRPDLEGPRTKLKAVYSFVKMKDGSEDFMVWAISQVEKIRNRSKAKDSGPWKTDYDEMAKKSVFRNHSKWLPLSADLRDKIERDDDAIDIAGSFELPDGGSAEATRAIAEEKKSRLRKVSDAPAPSTAPTITTTEAPLDHIDTLLAYKGRVPEDAFAATVKKHLDRSALREIEELPFPGDAWNALIYDIEDLLQNTRAAQAEAEPKPEEKKQSRLKL